MATESRAAPPSEPRRRALRGLARLTTEAPWTLRRTDLETARAAGLADAEVLHAIVLACFFGYLNRVADGVGIELDYEVRERPPVADPATPEWPYPDKHERPDAAARGPLDLGSWPKAAEAFASWRAHLIDRDAPLTRAERRVVAAVVADATGDAAGLRELGEPAPTNELERALAAYARTLALAPFRLGEAALAPLRALGLGDAALFDAIAVGAHQSCASRLTVALAAFAC